MATTQALLYKALNLQVPVPYIYIWEPKWVIIVLADVLEPNGARPSAGTVLTMKFDIFVCQIWLPIRHVEYSFADMITFLYIANQIRRNLNTIWCDDA